MRDEVADVRRLWDFAMQAGTTEMGSKAELAGCYLANSMANPAALTSDPVQFRVAIPAANPPDNQENSIWLVCVADRSCEFVCS